MVEMKSKFIKFYGKIWKQGRSFATYISIRVRRLAKLDDHEILEVIVKTNKRSIWYIGTCSHGRLIIPCHTIKIGQLKIGSKPKFYVRKAKDCPYVEIQVGPSILDLAQFLCQRKMTVQKRILRHVIKRKKLIVITTKSIGRRVTYISLNRFVNKEDIGTVLGYILSEGAKGRCGISFSNNEAILCKEFIDSLDQILAEKPDIKVTCIYNPNRTNKYSLEKLVDEFKKLSGIIPSERMDVTRPGNPIFEIRINNAALNDFLLTILDQAVKRQVDKELEKFIFSKGLKGDGSLCISKKEKRTRLNIGETNPLFQQFYIRYCEVHNLHVNYVNSRTGVYTSCPFEGLLYLYKLNIFKGTIQYPRLIASIALSLTQKRTKYIKVLMEIGEKAFNGFKMEDIMKIYEIKSCSRGVTRLMEIFNRGFIKKIKISKSAPVAKSVYRATDEVQETLKTLNQWKEEYRKLKRKLHCEDVNEIIEKIKIVYPGKNEN